MLFFFFFNDTATTEIYTLSLHDALPIYTHVYAGGTSLGVDPEAFARKSAVTTLVDTGSAGPGNFAGFRDHVIARSKPRILAYLNISFAGIYAFSKRVSVGERVDHRILAP